MRKVLPAAIILEPLGFAQGLVRRDAGWGRCRIAGELKIESPKNVVRACTRVIVLAFFLAIAAFVLSPAALARSGRSLGNNTDPVMHVDEYYCEASVEGATYISYDQLLHLRSEFEQSGAPSSFAGLSGESKQVVSEALRIGPAVSFSAARLLRDLIVIEALDEQAKCPTGRTCEKKQEIRYFKTGDSADASKDQSWVDLVVLWKKFRDQDAEAGRICLKRDSQVATLNNPSLSIITASKAELPASVTSASVVPPSTDKVCQKLAAATTARFVSFKKSRANIQRDELPTINAIASLTKECNIVVIVEGYTDGDGSANYNQKLSERRAAAVVAMLSAAGADQNRLRARGFGKSHPLVPNTTSTNKAKNRRVGFVLQ